MPRRLRIVLPSFTVLLVVAGLAAYRCGDARVSAEFRTPPPQAQPAATVTSGAAQAPTPPGRSPVALADSARPRGVWVRYRFDAGVRGAISDVAGRLPLRLRGAAGGTVSSTPRADGLAVRFPPPCPQYGAETCSRAILQSGPAAFLNPDRAAFRYGVTIKLTPSETSKGANVIQKGFAVGRSQFKLQVDGAAGRPSCVLVGVGSPAIHIVEAPTTVADGQWHQVDCARRDGLLTIAIDGRVRREHRIPPTLSIVNDDALCIGGKGTGANNDQFSGAIDDVYVAIHE